MAAPNVRNPTTITFKSSSVAMVSGGTDFVTNAAASGKVLKVELMQFSNFTTSNTTISVNRNKNGTSFNMLSGSISAGTTVQIVGPFYLEENDKISAAAADNSRVVGHIEYQDIS